MKRYASFMIAVALSISSGLVPHHDHSPPTEGIYAAPARGAQRELLKTFPGQAESTCPGCLLGKRIDASELESSGLVGAADSANRTCPDETPGLLVQAERARPGRSPPLF